MTYRPNLTPYRGLDRVAGVAKLGPAPFMTELLKEGLVHMNTAAYFRSLESDGARTDRNECALHCDQAENTRMTLRFNGKDIPIPARDQILWHPSDGNLARYKLWCLRAWYRSQVGQAIDLATLAFGDSIVRICDFGEFFRRLTSAAEARRLRPYAALVTYEDRRSCNGRLGVFHKFSEFASQQEYRIFVEADDPGPLRLRLGSLEDIAVMSSTHTPFTWNRAHGHPPTRAGQV